MTAGEWFIAACIFMLMVVQIGVWVVGARKYRRQRRDERVRQAYWDGHEAARQHDEVRSQVCSLEERITELMDWHEMLERNDQIEHPRWSEGWDAYLAGLQQMRVNQVRDERETAVAQSFVEGYEGERIAHREILSNRKTTVKLTNKFKKKAGPPGPPPPTSGAVTKRARRRT